MQLISSSKLVVGPRVFITPLSESHAFGFYSSLHDSFSLLFTLLLVKGSFPALFLGADDFFFLYPPHRQRIFILLLGMGQSSSPSPEV